MVRGGEEAPGGNGRRGKTKRESAFEARDILGKIFYPFKVRPLVWPRWTTVLGLSK